MRSRRGGPGDPAALRPVRLLGPVPLCASACLFGGLPPGGYLLTLCRRSCGHRLLLHLPPRTALTLCYDPCARRCCWHRDPFPCF